MVNKLEQRTKYHIPSTHQEHMGQASHVEHLITLPAIQKLAMQSLYPFTTSVPFPTQEGRSDTRLLVHIDGKKPYHPGDENHKEMFFQEATALVASCAHDFFDQAGQLRPEHQQNWFNLVEIVPDLVKAITDRRDTEKKTYITMVQEQYALNTLALALHLARHPNADLLIRMGIGGSDNDFTTARLAAYGLPAVSVAEAVQDVYAMRDVMKLRQRAVEKRVDREYPELDTKAKRIKGKELMGETNPSDELSPQEIAHYRDAYAIRTKPVRLEFVFASHAAEAINSVDENGMTAHRIHTRTQSNKEALQAYINTYHSGISRDVTYVTDKPWSEHTPFGKLQLEFFADLLQQSDDSDIQDTLALLQSRGGNRGGQVGNIRAAEYAAAHPAILGDRLDMPYTGTYVDRQGPREELLITIGGEPERHFNAVRQYLAAHATPETFLEYINTRAYQAQMSGNMLEAEELRSMREKVVRWQGIINAQRARYYTVDTVATPRPDLPLIQVPFICSIGETPVYYATDFDISREKPIEPHIAQLTEQIATMRSQRKTLTTAREIQDATVAITTAERVLHDEQALLSDRKRRRN